MYHGQPDDRVDLSHMPELTLSPSKGTKNSAFALALFFSISFNLVPYFSIECGAGHGGKVDEGEV
jgi:hypothetical protein